MNKENLAKALVSLQEFNLWRTQLEDNGILFESNQLDNLLMSYTTILSLATKDKNDIIGDFCWESDIADGSKKVREADVSVLLKTIVDT